MTSEIQKRLIIFASVLVVGILFLLPTFTNGKLNSSNWFSKPLLLGLDLSGGAYLVYEIKTIEAVKGRMQNTLNSIRSKLRDDKVGIVKPKVNEQYQIEFNLVSAASFEKAQRIIEDNFKEVSIVEKNKDDGNGKFVLGITPQQSQKIQAASVTQAIETLRSRVDKFGVAEAPVQKIGENRILLELPGISDSEAIERAIGSVGKLEFRLLPDGSGKTGTVTLKNDSDDTPIEVEDEILMTGDAIADASAELVNGHSEIHFTLTSEGRRIFGRVTKDNIGRQLAIVLDGRVRSHPNIEGAITDGSGRITGGFTMEEARNLKVVLKSGALTAPLVKLEDRKVGPTLGAESIQKGILAILIGFVGIVIFMVFYYRKAGLIAVGCLVVEMILLVAGLSMFGATLTLPGLAGLALTIGVAVDSNVLIFERIKDELKNGATRDVAVKAGFEKALTAIIDANMTTLISGLILYIFGTGAVRGFAVTLCLGILTTIYCAIFCSRLAFDMFELKGGKSQLSI